MANYSCKTFSPTTYSLATIHLLHTDRQTTTTKPVSRPLLKYGRLKTIFSGVALRALRALDRLESVLYTRLTTLKQVDSGSADV